MNLETGGQFIVLEENLTQGTGAEKNLQLDEKIVLIEDEVCRVEVWIKGEEAVVSIYNANGSSVSHCWKPAQKEFSRSSKIPLNHGASLDPEKQSLSVEFTKENQKIKRTILWRKTDARIT